MDLSHLESSPIDDRFKGYPPGRPPTALQDIGSQGWNVLREDIPFPIALLKESALAHNSRWMRSLMATWGVQIAPHGKTTMSPQLFSRQLADGAWGITLATANQACIARRFGVSRILLANQLVGRQNVAFILGELQRDPQFEFYCLVDSPESVAFLADSVAEAVAEFAGTGKVSTTRPLQVLVEGGFPGARCGARDLNSAMEVARAVRRSAGLALRGVEGFEGSIPASPADAPGEHEARIARYLKFLVEIARQCQAENLFAEGTVILSAGGSAWYDLVAAAFTPVALGRPTEVVLRGGCYLTHDSVFYRKMHEKLRDRSLAAAELGPGLQPALEVWGIVQSRPEPTRAVVSLGKRDCSFDLDLPVPRFWHRPLRVAAGENALGADSPSPRELGAGHVVESLNDQHALLRIPHDSPLAFGDLAGFGISHPCTTFDRWQWLPLVDDRYNVIGGIRTFF